MSILDDIKSALNVRDTVARRNEQRIDAEYESDLEWTSKKEDEFIEYMKSEERILTLLENVDTLADIHEYLRIEFQDWLSDERFEEDH